MPVFSFLDLQGKEFTNKDLKNAQGMFIYFNPLCDVCRAEMKVIRNNFAYFQDKPIYMVSPENLEDIKQFVKEFRLKKFPMIKVLYDKDDQFFKLFHTSGYPSIYIYNSQKQITSTFVGETHFEELKTAFEGRDNLAQDNNNSTIKPGN